MSEEVNYRGYTIKIKQDEICGEGPREWDNVGTMVCWHSRYNLGDEQPDCSPDEYLTNLAEEAGGLSDLEDRWERVYDRFFESEVYDFCKLEEIIEERKKAAVEEWIDKNLAILELYLYDHSGITMNTGGFSCPWDSGQVGFIYCTLEKAREELGGDTPEDIEARRKWGHTTPEASLGDRTRECLRREVETYDHFITGNVYGYTCEDPEGIEFRDGSCWGYYGYDHEKSGLLPDARAAIDCEITHNREQWFRRVKDWIRGGVPLEYREQREVGI